MEVTEGNMIKMEVTSGIHQGCTVSATLFKLVTHKIIQRIKNVQNRYEEEMFKINSLPYAEDGMIWQKV